MTLLSTSESPAVTHTSRAATHPPFPRSALWALATGWSLLVTVVAVQSFQGDDLDVYRAAGRALLDGVNPYTSPLAGTTIPYSYTPTATLPFVLLAVLSKPAALAVVTILSMATWCYVASRFVEMTWTDRWGATAEVRRIVTFLVITIGLVSEPVIETLGFGQLNFVLLALILADLTGRPRRSQGVLIGLATAVKLTPGIFILYLLITRRFRAAFHAAAAFAATIAVGFVILPGWSRTYWIDGVGLSPSHVNDLNYVANQSLLGALTRAVGESTATPWWRISCAVVIPVGLWTAARLYRDIGEVAGVTAAATIALIVSPYSWNHHWVWFLVPALHLAVRAWHQPTTGRVIAAIAWCVPFVVAPFWLVNHTLWRTDHHTVVSWLATAVWPMLALAALGAATWASATRRTLPTDGSPA